MRGSLLVVLRCGLSLRKLRRFSVTPSCACEAIPLLRYTAVHRRSEPNANWIDDHRTAVVLHVSSAVCILSEALKLDRYCQSPIGRLEDAASESAPAALSAAIGNGNLPRELHHICVSSCLSTTLDFARHLRTDTGSV